MTASFYIKYSFYSIYGPVAIGDIVAESIATGDKLKVEMEGHKIELRVSSVEIADNMGRTESSIGLILQSDSNINLKGIKLASQTVDVLSSLDPQ